MVLFNIGLLLAAAAACALMEAPCPCFPCMVPLAAVFRFSLADAAVEFALSVAI